MPRSAWPRPDSGKLRSRPLAQILLPLVALLVAGCTTSHSVRPSSADRARQVVTQPLNDLNLSRTRLPEPLVRARQAPFASGLTWDCVALANEIALLTQHLGPRFSAAGSGEPKAAATSQAEDAAWGAARGATGSLIPFRGIIRWLSGAEQEERKVEDAILAGYVRRAWLEGIGDERRCPRGKPP